MSVSVVPVRGPTTITPVRVGGECPPGTGSPVVGVQRPASLAELADVDHVDDAAPGAVLTKVGPGDWRGLPPEVREWWQGDGPPPSAIPGAAPGDFYFDRVGRVLYRLAPEPRRP